MTGGRQRRRCEGVVHGQSRLSMGNLQGAGRGEAQAGCWRQAAGQLGLPGWCWKAKVTAARHPMSSHASRERCRSRAAASCPLGLPGWGAAAGAVAPHPAPPSPLLALPLLPDEAPAPGRGGCGSSTPAAATEPAKRQRSGCRAPLLQPAVLAAAAAVAEEGMLPPEGSVIRSQPSREEKESSSSYSPLSSASPPALLLLPLPLLVEGSARASSRMPTT